MLDGFDRSYKIKLQAVIGRSIAAKVILLKAALS